MDQDISALRTQLAEDDTIATRSALGAALRQRWLTDGGWTDWVDWATTVSSIPRANLVEVGAVNVKLRPELNAKLEGHWVQLQPWLAPQGYMLPSRYQPDWQPSWLKAPNRSELLSADTLWSLRPHLAYATRISDNTRVILKICQEDRYSEVSIMAFFSSEPRRSDPQNHCYPLLDVLWPPLLRGRAHLIVVVPLLRSIIYPPPDTVGEMVKCISDFAEGLEFMHQNNVAHRDIAEPNVMVDVPNIVSEPWHPWGAWGNHDYTVYTEDGKLPRDIVPRLRSKFLVKYHFLDLGSSSAFNDPLSSSRLVVGTEAINRDVPELSETVPFDPFPADIGMFGDMVRDLFNQFPFPQRYQGLDFLNSLLTRMCHDDPAQRYSASEVVAVLDKILRRTSRITLR
ncbi:hypothetical protein EXIGLDRAFT_613190, partial [Exidia glandulosa HHB12029]